MDLLPELTQEERQRYSRHLILPEVAIAGQQRLKRSRVLVVGAGGLGSPAILYLAAAGVGTIGVADFDRVELSNLQRQILYSTNDVGKWKVELAVKRGAELNPEVRLLAHSQQVDATSVSSLVAAYDLVIDGTDNFATRYLINDACVFAGKPNVYGSIYRFEGQASVFAGGNRPCYRCLFPQPPANEAVPNCAEGGVLGVMAGLIGVIQATEALKLLLGIGSALSGRLLLYDAMSMRFDTLQLSRDPACPVCGDAPSIKTVEQSAVSCAEPERPCGSTSDLSANQLQSELSNGKFLILLDVRNQHEFELCHIKGAVHIPLAELVSRANEVDKEAEIVVYCKAGTRSSKAIEVLAARGFNRLRNLSGGILSWIRDVDPSLPSY
jgi:adenylyltransferase/sulfurtransferase